MRTQQEWTPVEWAIHEAMLEVESMGADVLLTDAIVALGVAKDKVQEYISKNEQQV